MISSVMSLALAGLQPSVMKSFNLCVISYDSNRNDINLA